jgi:sterol desaturase/sphingolipid hydroxylase (fatty acid hydroxylase superfamily)
MLSSVELQPLVAAVVLQSVAEYYWHRLMHWPPCYRRLHKLHHHYKSPSPFDDLFIHPLEAAGYACVVCINRTLIQAVNALK